MGCGRGRDQSTGLRTMRLRIVSSIFGSGFAARETRASRPVIQATLGSCQGLWQVGV
jgi:hypothetical protein